MKQLKIILASIVFGFTLINSANAQVLWSSTAAEFLYGFGFERDPEDQGILTIKHAAGWGIGDTFFFVDVVNIDKNDKGSDHLEWNVRTSMLRLFGKETGKGFFKDFLVSAQIDVDRNAFNQRRTDMFGVWFDFNVPGFNFVKFGINHRDDPNFDGSSEQFTLVWNKTFNIGEAKFSFEGFADYTTDEGDSNSNLLTTPQLLWHVNDRVAVGLEYQYWDNRLGIEGLDESAPQVMLRWTL